MPNNILTPNRTTLEEKIALASQKAVNHHGFFVGATRDNEVIAKCRRNGWVCGIKVFMGSSTDDFSS